MKSIIALALALVGLSTVPAQAGGRYYYSRGHSHGHTVAVLNTRLHYGAGYRYVRPVVRYATPRYSNYGYGYGGGYYAGYGGNYGGYCRPVYRACGYGGYGGYAGCGYGGYANYGYGYPGYYGRSIGFGIGCGGFGGGFGGCHIGHGGHGHGGHGCR